LEKKKEKQQNQMFMETNNKGLILLPGETAKKLLIKPINEQIERQEPKIDRNGNEIVISKAV
jgi:hypothetical protein